MNKRRLTFWLCVAVGAGCAFAYIGKAVFETRPAVNRTKRINRMMQLGGAVTNYESEMGHAPPPVVLDTTGRASHSWRAIILPYLGAEGESISQAYDYSSSWDSAENRTLWDRMPAAFALSGRSNREYTDYVVLRFRSPVKITYNHKQVSQQIRPFQDARGDEYLILECPTSRVRWLEPRDVEWNGDSAELADGSNLSDVLFLDYYWTIGDAKDLSITTTTRLTRDQDGESRKVESESRKGEDSPKPDSNSGSPRSEPPCSGAPEIVD